jgi:hypothetical protein
VASAAAPQLRSHFWTTTPSLRISAIERTGPRGASAATDGMVATLTTASSTALAVSVPRTAPNMDPLS